MRRMALAAQESSIAVVAGGRSWLLSVLEPARTRFWATGF